MNIGEKLALSPMLLPLGQMLQNISEKVGAHYSNWYLVYFLVAGSFFILPKNK